MKSFSFRGQPKVDFDNMAPDGTYAFFDEGGNVIVNFYVWCHKHQDWFYYVTNGDDGNIGRELSLMKITPTNDIVFKHRGSKRWNSVRYQIGQEGTSFQIERLRRIRSNYEAELALLG